MIACAGAGPRVGDLLLNAGGHEAAAAQDRQPPMFAEVIGRPLAVAVMRNGTLEIGRAHV